LAEQLEVECFRAGGSKIPLSEDGGLICFVDPNSLGIEDSFVLVFVIVFAFANFYPLFSEKNIIDWAIILNFS